MRFLPDEICCYEFGTKLASGARAPGSSANIFSRPTNLNSSPQRREVARGGTRVPCEIPITLTSLDERNGFSQDCAIILANLRGCAARCPRPVPAGTSVQLVGLPTKTPVEARVTSCIFLGEFEKIWLLGLALNQAGNVWGIGPVPDDWNLQG